MALTLSLLVDKFKFGPAIYIRKTLYTKFIFTKKLKCYKLICQTYLFTKPTSTLLSTLNTNKSFTA